MILYCELSAAFKQDCEINLAALSDVLGMDAKRAIRNGLVSLQLVNALYLLESFDSVKNILPLTKATILGITITVPRTTEVQSTLRSVFIPWSNIACVIDLGE